MYESYPQYPNMNLVNPYQQRYSPSQSAFQPRYEITRVNGENGAEMLPMGARSSVIALDQSRSDILLGWFIQTDDAGYKTKTPYVLTPYQPSNPQSDFEARLQRLEEIVNAKQSTVTNDEPKPKKSGKSTD